MLLGNSKESPALRPGESQTSPIDAKAVIEAHPSATPSTIPASTSLRKCIPSTMRDTAMFNARNKS